MSLLALALLLGPAAAPLRAQQPAQGGRFAGSMFDGGKKKDEVKRGSPEAKAEGAEPAEASAAPSPSPVPYMTVAVRYAPGAAVEPQGTAQQPAPSSNNPPPQTGAPAQGAQTASPTQSQTQQSTNPAAPAQGPRPAQPAVPPAAPADANLPTPQAPAPSMPAQPQPGAPGGQVQAPVGPPAPGRESVPTAPADAGLDVPPVAPDFRAEQGPFPVLERVGVNMGQQRPLSVREVIEMALANNKDIEVARENVRVAEFDLQAARGVYDPRFLTNSYYERSEQPAASFLSGSSTGAVTQSGFFSNSSVQGLTPRYGGGYRLDFVNNRVTTNNQFAALNPQYPTALTFSYTQPVLRGLRFDQNRRLIEIAKKNLSLTDAQFRQRAVETITNVQRAYWDLVYALRNLQIQ
ncbi:MAG TPA: TolC family protein, partial [Pyrinomonadaceae bacterium]